MKNFTLPKLKIVSLAIFLFSFSIAALAQTSEVIVSVNWPSWSGENYMRVYDPLGNILLDVCNPSNCYNGANTSYSTTINMGCLPNDTGYSIRMWDRYGDQWNGTGANVTITSGPNTVLNTNHGGGANSTASFNVYGGGGPCVAGPQEINLLGNGIEIADNDTTPDTADGTDLGSAEGTVSISQTFSIINNGASDLNLTGTPRVAISGTNAGDFSIVAQPAAVITGGSSVDFTVTFTRSTIGTSNAVITILNDDSNESTYNFNITAESLAPQYTLYYENFDQGDGGWISNNGSFGWTLGTTFEKGEGNYWYTDNFDNFPSNASATLTSSNISTLGYTNLKLWVDFRTNTNDVDDGMQIQYSANGGTTWTTLGSVGSGDNWYNQNDVDGISNNEHGWTGSNSTASTAVSRFEEASHELPTILNNNPLTRFRVRFGSDNDSNVSDGVLIDNIIITGTPMVLTAASDGPADVRDELTLWLRSQYLPYTDGSILSTWPDMAIGNDANENPSNAPTFANNVTENINFNPTVNFDRSQQQHMRGKGGFNSNDYWIVVRSSIDMTGDLAGETMLIGAKVSKDSPAQDPSGLGWGPVSVRYDDPVIAHSISSINSNGLSPDSYGRSFSSTTRTFDDVHILNVKNNSTNNQTEIYLNGRRIDNQTGMTTPSRQDLDFLGFTNRPFYLGAGRYELNGLPFETHLDGQITEVFSYRDRLSETVQQKIYSYLAIKNGVSLHNPTSTLDDHRADWDYLASDDSVIWDYSANTNYNYDVAAIGRDDNSELNQKQSKSENSTSIVALGISKVEDLGTSNTSTFENDKDFLIWGHNGQDLNAYSNIINHDLGIANAVTTNLTRMNRVWKINEVTTTDIGKTEMRVTTSNFSGLPALTANSEYVLIVADDENFTSNLETAFFKEDGIYQRTSYDFDGTKYFSLGITYVAQEDRSVIFDGVDDHIEIIDGEGLGSRFTCSVWVYSDGANSTNSNKTIIAKRQGNTGFQMFLRPDNRVTVWWNNGSDQEVTSNTSLSDNAWRHIAVTYDGNEVNLYIDGVLDINDTKTPPSADSNVLAIGARFDDESTITEHWKGELDEIRMWRTALTVDQIRFIMNQELENYSDYITGTVIPYSVTKNEVSTLDWDQLNAYYSMNSFIGTALNDESVNKGYGRMANENYFELRNQTAPLPYESTADGSWENQSSWENGSMLFTPGSYRNIAGNTVKIDWNIVRTNNNLTIENTDVALLGLMSESQQIDVENSHGLTITHYLELDGIIDLQDESQLVQTEDSDLVISSAGYIERDQQGTADTYNYNYWSSPVSRISNSSNNDGFTIAGQLKDGTFPDNPRDLNFTSQSVGNGAPGNATTAATISGRWLYKYGNQASGQYSNWQFLNPSSSNLNAGEGWTMKGTGATSSDQNYVFVGKPNNGDINLPINNGNDYLIGNPYPSALDAHEFINDNPNLDGTIYFWEHWGGNSHQLQLYQGGYAMYNLSGGLGNATFGTSHPSVNQGGIATKEPGRFIPVAQGFFVTGISNGTIRFRNDQRQFVTEASGNSIFVAAPGSNANSNPFSGYNTINDTRPKFRIGFDSPSLIHRQLLLTVDPNASMAFDRAFDGYQYDTQTDDMSFKLGSQELNIQGIDQINQTTIIPLHVTLGSTGVITIKIDELENVAPTQGIFLKDAQTNIYYDLRASDYVSTQMWAGTYPDRFFIVFEDPTTLSNDNVPLDENDLIIYTPTGQQTLNIKKGVEIDIESVTITNMLGQQVKTWDVSEQEGIISVPTYQIARGNYIVSMETSYGLQTRKVIIE